MSGLAWANITPIHAQSVGGQRRGRHIYGRHWRRMAGACGLAGPATVRCVRDLTTPMLAEIPAAVETQALPTGGEMLAVFVTETRVRLVQAHAAVDGLDVEDDADDAVADDRPRDGAHGR